MDLDFSLNLNLFPLMFTAVHFSYLSKIVPTSSGINTTLSGYLTWIVT